MTDLNETPPALDRWGKKNFAGATAADAALLAHAHLLSGNPRRALAALQRPLTHHRQQLPASASPDPRVRLLAARCLAALGRWEDVLDCLGSGSDGSDGEEARDDDDDDGEDDGAGFLDLRPDENGAVPFDRAARAAGADAAAAAAAAGFSPFSSSPSSSSSSLLADAWLLRARARSAAGDARGAARAFESALRRDPRCIEAFDALVVGGLAPPARHSAIVTRAARRLSAEGDSWLADLLAARCACAPGCGGGGGGGGGSGSGNASPPSSSLARAEAALARLQADAAGACAASASDDDDIGDNGDNDGGAAAAAATSLGGGGGAFHSPEGGGGSQPRRVTRAMARSGEGGGSASGGAGSVSGGGGSTSFFTPGRGSGAGAAAAAAPEPPVTVSSSRRGAAGAAGTPPTRCPPPGRKSSELPSVGHGLSASADVAAAAAALALARGDPRLARSVSSRALSRDPGATLALRVHVAACAELGARTELFSLAHGLVADSPKSPEAWHAVGAYYLSSRNPRAARRAFARALACCDGDHAAAWVGLGHACSLAGEGDAAVGKSLSLFLSFFLFSQLRRLDEKANLKKMIFFLPQKNKKAAYRAAGGLAPGSAAPLLGQGVEAARMGASALAASLLRAAHEAAPADPAPCHELAVLALGSRSVGGGGGGGGGGGDGDEDDDDDDDDDDDVAKRGGDPAAAEAWARRALSLSAAASAASSHPCSASCEPTLVLLGHALLRQRKPEEACEAFERAIASGGGGGGGNALYGKGGPSSSTFVALGVARHASGDPSGAAEAYHSALAVAPGDSLAAELLDSALRDEADEASEWLDGA
jgi:tetratricopeptide (TPR) repeat protein